MKKNLFLIFLLTLLSFLLVYLHTSAGEITLGGQLNVSLTGLYDEQAGSGFFPQANFDLELFFPRQKNDEFRCAGYLYTDTANQQINFFWKRLYWKHRFDRFQMTVGRQPISWSFGALLNPFDYSLGATALDTEYHSQFQNAIEFFYPFNWNTSLSLVASSPGSIEDLKVGLRGRTLIHDFDVSANFIQEKVLKGNSGQQRFGITAKGDIGKYGVYGGLGYSRDIKESFSLLFGVDYSYFFQRGSQLYLQVEYLNIPSEIVSQMTGSMMTAQLTEKNIHLLVGNLSYQIDEFSNLGLAFFYHPGESSVLCLPTYSNQLKSNTKLKIQAGIKANQDRLKDLSSFLFFPDKVTQMFFEIGFDYVF